MDDKTVGFFTFYIGNGNVDKYVRDDPWTVLEDEPETGTTCYVDQMITDKNPTNKRFSWLVMRMFHDFLNRNYPKVNLIRWNRLKKGVPHVYRRRIN